jgi:Arc/MetJ-type ribon-helix-helix transcriptional regulator
MMSNQENPGIRIVGFRVTQQLFRQLEKLAERRGFRDVSSMVRALVIDAVSGVELTAEDHREIAARIDERKKKLEGGSAE